MVTVWKNTVCEVIYFEDKINTYRLYCEEISHARELSIINSFPVEHTIQSTCEEKFDEALMIDYNKEDHETVVSYLGLKE